MNHTDTIKTINAAIETIRHDDYTDSDVARLIDLSPGHYFDLALQYKVLESPHRTMNALERSLKMMDEKDPLIDYFLHRLAHDKYDSIIFPILKTPGQEKIIQGFLNRSVEKEHMPKLVGKSVQMANRFKSTQRLDVSDINALCTAIAAKPHADSLPYEQKFLRECRRGAQIREAILALPETEIGLIELAHRKRALVSAFVLTFLDKLGDNPMPDMKQYKPLLSMPLSDIQESFNMAFSLIRDNIETAHPHAAYPKEKIRNDVLEISEAIALSLKSVSGIQLDKPKRILNALDKMVIKPVASSRTTESLTHH